MQVKVIVGIFGHGKINVKNEPHSADLYGESIDNKIGRLLTSGIELVPDAAANLYGHCFANGNNTKNMVVTNQ